MKSKRDEIDEWVNNTFPDEQILIADGLEEAFMGVAMQFNKLVAIFDHDKCINILIERGLTFDEATEYFYYNVLGAYVGEQTPAFLLKFKSDENTNN